MVTNLETTSKTTTRGNPAGTRFAVGAMILLLVAVGIYFLAVQGRELDKSPVVNGTSTPAPASSNGFQRVQLINA